jgi:O-antigen/teichoic acid export membrane protein
VTIKSRAFSAVRWTTAGAVFRTFFQLLQVGILARLLEPEDYGLMALVSVVLGFAMVFADMGVNSAFVQRQDVTQEQRSSLFWLNIGVAIALTLVVFFCSPFIAGFFNDERLFPVLQLASLTFVSIALGQQIKMNAEKELAFRPLVLIEMIAAIAGFFVAVVAALYGLGVYALVLGTLINGAMVTILAWIILSRGWRPMFRFRATDIRSFLGFGLALVSNNLINELNRSADLLVGGRALSVSSLGVYSLPRQMVYHVQGVVNPIITRVGFPLIASVQTDIPKVRYIYLQTLNMCASTNAPLYIGVAFFSPEIVQIFLGDDWLSAADILRLLAIWGFFRSTGNPLGSLLLGVGRADLALYWNLMLLLILFPALWAGAQYGAMGLAWMLVGVSIAMFVPGWYFLVRPICKAGIFEYSIAALRPAFLSVSAITPAYFLMRPITNIYVEGVVVFILSSALYLGLSFFLNRNWLLALKRLVIPGRG